MASNTQVCAALHLIRGVMWIVFNSRCYYTDRRSFPYEFTNNWMSVSMRGRGWFAVGGSPTRRGRTPIIHTTRGLYRRQRRRHICTPLLINTSHLHVGQPIWFGKPIGLLHLVWATAVIRRHARMQKGFDAANAAVLDAMHISKLSLILKMGLVSVWKKDHMVLPQ